MQHSVLHRPGEHGGVWFRLLLVRQGADVQRGQVHAQQLRYPLSAIDVTIFVQHLTARHKYPCR